MGRRISMLVILLIVLIGVLVRAKEKGNGKLMQKTILGPDFLAKKEWKAPPLLKPTPITASTDVKTTIPLAAKTENHQIQNQEAAAPHFDQISTGFEGQTKSYDVTPTVGSPYDEDLVDFYHDKQRITNFGALRNV